MRTSEAVIYTRVSTEDQAEHGTSLAGQLEANKRTAMQVGATIVAHYEDAGVSGAIYATRYGLQKALADMETGKANMLIVYDVTRLSRDTEHLSAIVKRIKAAGARLVFHNGHFEDTPEGEMLLGVNGVFSQYERQKFRERSMKGKERRLKEGKQPCVGMSPYGYHIVSREDVIAGRYPAGTNGTYIVMEEEAHWVSKIFERYCAGYSLREIARWLQCQGVPPPSHAADRIHRYATPPRPIWHANTIAAILDNPVYKGLAAYGKRKHKSDEARIAQGWKRKDFNERITSDKWQYVVGTVPAIVDAETWNSCQERKQQNKEARGGNPLNKCLLTGLLTCPNCGRGLHGTRRKYSNRVSVSYRCRDYTQCARSDGKVCNPRHYNEKNLIETIERGITRCTPLLESTFDAYNQTMAQEDITPRLMQLRKDLDALETRERAAVEGELAALSAGRNAAVYRKVLDDVNTQCRALQSQCATLEAQQETRLTIDAKGYAEVLQESLENLWLVLDACEEEVSTGEKNAMLSRVIHKIKPGEEETEILLHPRRSGATVTQVGINLAARIEDGTQLFLPTRKQHPEGGADAPTNAPGAAASSGAVKAGGKTGAKGVTKAASAKGGGKSGKLNDPTQGKVNINTASVEELERLPGIGPAMAERISEFRKQGGKFTAPEDLLQISGIGEKKFARMQPFVKVR